MAGVRWSGASYLAAVRAAVCCAHRPLVTRPSTMIATPHPISSSQSAWLAGTYPVRSGPCRFAARIEPAIATPSEVPIWRLVEAIPEATPACAKGMPDTAAWVIGALTMPDPRPKTLKAMTICDVDHDVVIPDSNTPPATIPAPAATVGRRP